MLGIYKKVAQKFVLAAFLTAFLFGAPLSIHGIKQAGATYSVAIVADGSITGISTLTESALTTAENVAQTYFASQENFKEMVLDPLFWSLSNTLISNMLSSLTDWVNSGFQGSPAFVTDIEGFLIDAADQAAGDFINGTELGFLCSPFQLDVRIALSLQYQQTKSFGGQCTLTGIANNMENFLNGTFSEGGWAGWFELTQGGYNDPNRAFLEGRAYLGRVVLRTRDREFEILKANEFFLDVKVCKDTDAVTGAGKNCTTGTPGNIVQDIFIDATGAPLKKITFADEFDELLGALLSQFANQAIMGVNGILGLSSGGGYGSGGNFSYLDAMQDEVYGDSPYQSADIINDAIDLQIEYIGVLDDLITMVDDAEQYLEAVRDDYPRCFRLRMPSSLRNARTDAEEKIIVAQNTIELFTLYAIDYDSATTPDERLDIMMEFDSLYADIYAQTLEDIRRTEVDIEYLIPRDIDELEDDIRSEINRCEIQLFDSN